MEIRRLRRDDRDGAIALILSILTTEFDFDVTRAHMADIDDAETFYGGDSAFWVAVDDGRIVGTIALKRFSAGGALRRMFVAADRRRREYAVGEELLRTLTEYAARMGMADIYLGTTDAFRGAHRFYEKNGFVRVDKSALPSDFPAMPPDNRFYKLRLAKP